MVFIEKVLFRLNVALFPILNSVHSPNLPVSFSFPSNSLIYIHLSLSFIFPTHWKPKSHVPSCVAGVAVALRGYCQTIFRGVFCPESTWEVYSGQQTTPGPHFYSNTPCTIRQYRGGTATRPPCKQLTVRADGGGDSCGVSFYTVILKSVRATSKSAGGDFISKC